ncbi:MULTISPECIES: ABC transporter substrate-binding protein [unclassified Vibrio]|uniref:ABC transporter substrate-binding protein n=1 Tax=Vibrio sp. HB236076 TaxID=3232307 RepID=A0AB39HGH2_9VIBR|nr:ABC transporter substrate-binding protein [Vibrio sp. HB161653]MDP5254969.1 ABC transporter substrate-binding protein [Vibrio sp. HB161653]
MNRKITLSALLLTAASTSAYADDCGRVTIADMNWNSASFIANVDKFILEYGYGCDAELVPGDTMPTTTSMIEKGEPDIAPELWTNSAKEAIEKGVEEKRLINAGPSLTDGGQEGFWIPTYMLEKHPELSTIEGIKKHPELFKHPEDPSVGGFYGCPAGWNCQISSGNLFKALHLQDAGFQLVDPGSSAGLSGSIAKAYERGEGWFGYYWAPTAILGKYDMTLVDLGSGVDEEEFTTCTTQENCADPKVTMYPPSPVSTLVASTFANAHPKVMEYLSHRGFTNDELNSILAWMEGEQATSEDAMFYFLDTHPDIWKKWVSKEAAEKISAEL